MNRYFRLLILLGLVAIPFLPVLASGWALRSVCAVHVALDGPVSLIVPPIFLIVGLSLIPPVFPIGTARGRLYFAFVLVLAAIGIFVFNLIAPTYCGGNS